MNLSSKLWTLSKKAVNLAKKYKSSDKMVIRRRPYIKSNVTSFNYNQGNIGYGKSFEDTTKDEWDTKNHYDFIEKSIKPLKEYKEVIKIISKLYKVGDSQSDVWISRFIQIISNYSEDPLSSESLVDKISNFVCDLNNGPFSWQSTIWINGVWLSGEEYQLSPDVKIRKLNEKDLEDEKPLDMLISYMPGLEAPEAAAAILEVNFRTDKQPELHEEIEAVIECLKLFGTGSIYRVKSVSSSESILSFGGTQFSNSSRALHYKYEINGSNISNLNKLIDLIKSKLIKLKKDSLNPLNIAFQRYEDSVLSQGVIENRVTSAITCLEALFLKSEERTELSGRLSQRAGLLLSIESLNSLQVQRDLLRAYEIRSIFIHGSTLPQEEQQKSKQLIDRVIDYARVSLLIFICLDGSLEKINLINKLDNSLLDPNARADLMGILKSEYKEKIS